MSEVALARAQAGDDQAFRELIDPHLRELQVHCYRLLGSLPDAEDAVQETLMAAWHGLPGFEERSSLRAWLYRIATNRCLNARRAARRRLPPSPPFDPPAPTRHGEVPWLQPYPGPWREGSADTGPGPEARYESRETIELAFIAALQRLSPRQAAVLVLRDVLGFSTAEVAAMLDTTPTSVKGIVQRARAGVGGSLCASGGRPPEPGSAREQAITRRFAAAFAADDIAGVIALLTDDAWLSMPPALHEYQGRAAIGAFLRASADWRAGRRFQLLPARANTQPAFGCYLSGTRETRAEAAGLIVLTLRGDQISAITRFLDPDVLRRFGLPLALHPRAGTMADVRLAFRFADEHDIPAIVGLVDSAYRGEAGWTTEAHLLDGQRTDADAVRAAVRGPGSAMLVAEAGRHLVGCCQLERRPAAQVYFGMFSVRPGCQGRGLGREILAEAERLAWDDWGARTMVMTVLAQRGELIGWYERRGYHRTGESKPFPYDDVRSGIPKRPDLSFVVLSKSLAGGPP